MIILIASVLMTGCSFQQEEFITETPTAVPATITPSATIIWFPATSTPTRQVTIQPTGTPQTSLRFGAQVVDDQFDTKSGWMTGIFPSGNIVYGEETLNLAVAASGGSLITLRDSPSARDFYLEVSAMASLCTREDTFGVIFWAVNDRTYHRVAFNCGGLFRLEKVVNNKVTALTEWFGSTQAARTPGVPVRIGLWVGGGLVQVYLNDDFEFSHAVAPTTGSLGFFAASNSSTAITSEFSDLQIYQVSAGDYPPTSTPTIRPTKTALPTIPTP
jgi:hypothetical protein